MSTVHGGDDGHITTSSSDRLVYMANQIAQFFGSQKHDAAVAGIADHIGKFWDPRMRSMIFAHLAACGGSLSRWNQAGLAAPLAGDANAPVQALSLTTGQPTNALAEHYAFAQSRALFYVVQARDWAKA